MSSPVKDERTLRTSEGDFALDEYRLKASGREWKILHVGAVLSREEESNYLSEKERLPYGVTLWASAVALAHDVASRPEQFRGKHLLELGSGTGLPGIVAASLGARVLQTDRNELAMSVCRRNASLNAVETTGQRVVDWTSWEDAERYEWILGSDILYDKEMHRHLRRIFQSNLAPGGRILLSDPFREPSFNFLESLEKEGWAVTMSKWTVGEDASPRTIGVFELGRA